MLPPGDASLTTAALRRPLWLNRAPSRALLQLSACSSTHPPHRAHCLQGSPGQRSGTRTEGDVNRCTPPAWSAAGLERCPPAAAAAAAALRLRERRGGGAGRGARIPEARRYGGEPGPGPLGGAAELP